MGNWVSNYNCNIHPLLFTVKYALFHSIGEGDNVIWISNFLPRRKGRGKLDFTVWSSITWLLETNINYII